VSARADRARTSRCSSDTHDHRATTNTVAIECASPSAAWCPRVPARSTRRRVTPVAPRGTRAQSVQAPRISGWYLPRLSSAHSYRLDATDRLDDRHDQHGQQGATPS